MKRIFIIIAAFIAFLQAETLFEVKDSSEHTVLNVSTDGLRIMNYPDTIMVISSNEIKANLDSSKGLSRFFSVTTSASKGSDSDIMKVTADSTRIWVKDAGKGFQISSRSTLAKATADTSYMSVDNKNTLLGLGAGYRINPNVTYTNGNKYNTMFGYQAGFNTFGISQNTEASFNIFIGYQSGFTNTSGSGNIYIGNQSGYYGINNSNNTFLGTYSGQNTGGSYNTFLGYSAGQFNIGGARNTFVGQASGSNNTTGSYNAYFGAGSGGSFDGNYNTFMGYQTATWFGGGSGNSNVMIGYQAGSNSTSTAHFSGANNVILGYQAGLKTITGTFSGTGNVLIGYQAGSGSQKYSNKLFIENSNADSTNALIWGDFANNKLKFNGTVQVKNGTEIGKVQAGELTVGLNSSVGVKTVTLTFPTAFSSVPKITATPRCADSINDIFTVNVRNITTTSCMLMIYRIDSPGSSWGQNLKVDWYAWE